MNELLDWMGDFVWESTFLKNVKLFNENLLLHFFREFTRKHFGKYLEVNKANSIHELPWMVI